MDRRTVLQAGFAAAAGTAAGASSVAGAMAGGKGKTGFVLVHGSWHGAWCWGLVEPRLNQAGHISLAIDLPGHGLDAAIPDSFRSRPLDPLAFGTEPSAIAGIGIGSYADAVISAADRVRAMGRTGWLPSDIRWEAFRLHSQRRSRRRNSQASSILPLCSRHPESPRGFTPRLRTKRQEARSAG